LQFSARHNACVYETDRVQEVLDTLSEARPLNGSSVVVPCNVINMILMHRLGFEPFSPILHEYDWPAHGFKPLIHQRKTASFLTLNPRAFNLSDIGTGKTLSALWALDYLMLKGFIKKALVLSPLSTLERVWGDEIFRHFMGRRSCTVVHGSRNKRERALGKDVDIYIMNHDGLGVGSGREGARGIKLGGLAEEIHSREDINAVIVDEGSVYKDSGTLRYKLLRKTITDKPFIWWMTGTPTPNQPTDAWSQARIVRLDYTESQQVFKDRTMVRISTFKWVPKAESAEAAAKILQPAIRFTREECIDLPPLVVEDRDVALTTNQTAAIKKLKDEARVLVGQGDITAVNEAAMRLKVIQVACGAVYDAQHATHFVDAKPRISVLKEILEQVRGKIIVFSPLTSVINLLNLALKDDYTVACVNGQVSMKERSEIFRAFQQNPDPRIIIADPRSMAHGLTLTEASTIVWYAPVDMPEVYTQANGRINRPGQKNRMLVFRLMATPLEREIFRRLDSKESMQGLILELLK
jgi:SNF2 family DNA or RNA helicase